MGDLIFAEAGLAAFMILGAALLGLFLQRGCGLILLAGAAALAAGLCILGTRLAGWPGLLVAIGVVAWLGARVGHKLGQRKGARLISGLWLGLCLSGAVGYWIAGSTGALLIAPAISLLFWGALYLFSGFLLPLRDSSQRDEAFHSLLTFSLGTNYPYYVMNDRELEKRVDGSPYKSFFCGPGIVITDCDHLAVITDGSNIKVPDEPGLTFTGRFEVIQRVMDLRPQLKAFPVEARTLDGIPLRVLTFCPFHIHWGGQKPTPGKPFPFQKRAIFQAVTAEPVEQGQKRGWEDLVVIHGTRIMQDIISRYKFDDLCLALGPCINGPADDLVLLYQSDEEPAPADPRHDPRLQIRSELVTRLRKAMKPFGIEVLGGGISNLLPTDNELIQQRIANWRTKWQNRIMAMQAEGDAQRAHLIGQAQARVEQELLIAISKMLADTLAEGEDMSDELLAAAVVASLEGMANKPGIKLEQDTRAKLTYLRSIGKPLLLSAPSAKRQGE